MSSLLGLYIYSFTLLLWLPDHQTKSQFVAIKSHTSFDPNEFQEENPSQYDHMDVDDFDPSDFDDKSDYHMGVSGESEDMSIIGDQTDDNYDEGPTSHTHYQTGMLSRAEWNLTGEYSNITSGSTETVSQSIPTTATHKIRYAFIFCYLIILCINLLML